MAAAATGVEERLLIGGEWVEAEAGGRFDVTDPAHRRDRRLGARRR